MQEHVICIRVKAASPEAAERITRQIAAELTDRKGLQRLVKEIGPFELGHFYVFSGDVSQLLKTGMGIRQVA